MLGAQNRLGYDSRGGGGWLRSGAVTSWPALQRMPLLPIAAAAAVGIVLQSAADAMSAAGWIFVSLIILGLAARLPPRLRWLAAVLMFTPVFAVRLLQRTTAYRSADILQVATADPRPAIVEGIVDRAVAIRRHPMADQRQRRGQSPWQTEFELELTRWRSGHRFEPRSGRLLVLCDDRFDELRPGDQLRVYGSLRSFTPPTNPGERDLRNYYRRRFLHARMQVSTGDQLLLLNRTGPDLASGVASLAAAGRDLLLEHVAPAQAGLAVALVIGQRDLVEPRTRDLLLVTGTAHLLSVSGLHLAIVVLLARWLVMLLPLPHWLRLLTLIAVCLLYTALTGARPPVVRAAVLVCAVTLSWGLRRPAQPLNTLALAALLLIAYNPELIFSVGAQLSFLAVATLLVCGRPRLTRSPVLRQAADQQQRFNELVEQSYGRPRRYLVAAARLLGQMTWFSLCVTAVSLPLVWYHFHVISPVSVLTNVLLSPMLFVALGSGLVTITAGSVAEPLAVIAGWLCDRSLACMQLVIEQAAAVPGGHYWLPSPPGLVVASFYLVLSASLLLPTTIGSRVRYGWIAAWCLTAWLAATTHAPLPAGTMEATFVDVGHGTSVVVRCSDRRFGRDDAVWLYDCGRLGNESGSSRGIDSTLWSMGVVRLDRIVLSHADADHFNALPGLLRRFDVGEIVTPPGMLRESEPALIHVRQEIARAGVPVRELSAGRLLEGPPLPEGGGLRAMILHPPRSRLSGSDNANSLVLRIDHGGKSLLLPGDLEPPGTERLIDQPRPVPGSVLMAPHHGSLAMDAETILNWGRPAETIVSGGPRARRPEVSDMLSSTGSGVRVTAAEGAIRVRIDEAGRISIRSWLETPW